MKEYKAVSGPKIISVEKGAVGGAFVEFASLINREAVDGWEYHSMSTITIAEKQGCFQPPIPTNHYMLIFEREK